MCLQKTDGKIALSNSGRMTAKEVKDFRLNQKRKRERRITLTRWQVRVLKRIGEQTGAHDLYDDRLFYSE
jgi:hypothetical protein